MKPSERLFVLAGDTYQFMRFVRSKRLDLSKVQRIRDCDSLRGTKDVPVCFVGTWYQLRDERQIRDALQIVGSTEVKEHDGDFSRWTFGTRY